MSIHDIGREAVARWWRGPSTGTADVSVAADVVLDTIVAPEHRDALVAWLTNAGVIEHARAEDDSRSWGRVWFRGGDFPTVEVTSRWATTDRPGSWEPLYRVKRGES